MDILVEFIACMLFIAGGSVCFANTFEYVNKKKYGLAGLNLMAAIMMVISILQIAFT